MNKTFRDTLDVIWYLVAFYLIQYIMMFAVGIGSNLATGKPLMDAFKGAAMLNGNLLVLMMLFSSILTILIFGQFRWSPWSRDYLRSHPWGVVFWTAVLSLGTILPSEWLLESLQVQMPEQYEKFFEEAMGTPMGYIVIGVLAPVAEEMCFRGAILRKLLTMFSKKQHWIPIVVSAIIFGLVHVNVPQFIHATVIGLIMGWLYYRTDSIFPGVVFHWMNNTVAFIMFNLMPEINDGKLIDLFHGNTRVMVMGLICSVIIMLPAFFQLNQRMKRAKES
ncbi:MAG: CPBP family intramembrane glutamic endopeptidase [Prevotella sp.]|jgi:membrane protease YdiL (CAAX protease family)